ncbi:MAG: SDR family NAD(P)-dependent oxidoreductase [Spirochaetota bacterium]
MLITGATSGIGAAFAAHFASRGSRLILTGRRRALLEERRDELIAAGAPQVELETGDLAEQTTGASIEALVRERRPDVLVNNAGFSNYVPVADAPVDELESLLTVLVRVPMRLCNAALPAMIGRGEGLVINVGSLAGRVPVPGAALYVSSKVFLERFTETLAIEAASHGVAVQALTPGYVRTDFHRDVEDYREKRRNRGLVRWMDSTEVVRESMRAAERALRRLESGRGPAPRRRDVVVVPGLANRVLASVAPFVPRTLIYRAVAERERM